MNRSRSWLGCAFGAALAIGALVAEPADARRGGSFGSRGMRTYSPPPATKTAPMGAAPIQRSMTPQTPGQPGARPATAANAQAGQPQRRGGFLGGLGGGILGGLLVGGLIGALMGNGLGAGGMGTVLLQILIAGLAAFLLMKLFRRRQQPQPALAGFGRQGGATSMFETAQPAYGAGSTYTPTTVSNVDLIVTPADREAFERLLGEVQDAFGREDYAALRERTTPEIMSFLAEELGANATQGRRNEVSAVRLLEADVAEAWREGDADYATAALRYESVDIMRDRETGAVVAGDPDQLTETTEHWTFVRQQGQPWKLSAIQTV